MSDPARFKRLAETRYANGMCVTCGKRPHRPTSKVCQVCVDQNSNYINSRSHAIRVKALAYLGGKCAHCGYTSDRYYHFDYHHTNPQGKVERVAMIIQKGKWEDVKAELDKCILLCAFCHRDIHAFDALARIEADRMLTKVG